MERPRVEAERYDARRLASSTEVRPYTAPQPLTELRYLAGATIQSVDAIHVQERRRSLFGRPGVLNVLGAYSGRECRGRVCRARLRDAPQERCGGPTGGFGTSRRRGRWN